VTVSTPSSDSPAPKPRRVPLLVRVETVAWLTPHLVRIGFGGEALAGFEAGEFSDHYVKLQLPPHGADYSAPFDNEVLRAELPPTLRPKTRTYTVSGWDPVRRRLSVDFVVHGEEGVAGPWAAAAAPGDVIQLLGPGGAYSPDPEAAWHLMAGDAAVMPAIGASLGRVAAGVPVFVVLQVEAADRLPFSSEGDLRLEWIDDPEPEALTTALRRLELPAGRGHAFVHGEATAVRAARRHLVVERGLPPERLSASGYWKRSRTEEGWREDKAEWKRLVAADEKAVATSAAGAGAVGSDSNSL
jgi:NADPH-dependent ferric siderophore reductase